MKKNTTSISLAILINSSLIIKLFIIIKYGRFLTLSSDDLNYIKSGIILLEKGILTYQSFTEPTVFITPGYPVFLAFIFSLAGHDYFGIQVVRVVQALFSSLWIILVFYIAKELSNERTALISAILVSFYMPNITTPGYIMTETLFTTLLLLLVYYSLIFSAKPKISKFIILGSIWAAATLCRPTIALYPVLLIIYLRLYCRISVKRLLKLSAVMLFTFALIMLPWWLRNFQEYGEFIPLAASSGNPMLQGTYIDYKQAPEDVINYQLGKNSFETNKIEIQTAMIRIKSEINKDLWGYLKWYAVGKTKAFWSSAFYWKEFLGVNHYLVLSYHYVLLLGFAGMAYIIRKGFTRFILPISAIFYFNLTHCVFMAFDRYAFPVMPLLTIFCSVFLVKFYEIVRKANFSINT